MFIKKNILIICLLFCTLVFAEKTTQGFGDTLYQQENYTQALYAYQQALYYAETGTAQDPLKFKIAKTYLKLNQFEKAKELLDNLVENSATLKKEAHWKLATEYFQRKEFELAGFELQNYGEIYKDKKAEYLSAWAELSSHNYDKAQLKFARLAEAKEHTYSLASAELSEKALAGKNLPQRSIGTAQFLSYIIPGSGQVYAENWQDGVVSFLVNGLTISLLSTSLRQNRTGEALIWLTLETAWYFGGVYSAGNSANKYNENVRERYLEDLDENYNYKKLLD